ncbi:hypothetical protein [Euryhalocaulis caribicus]|uniref:hypothetical protein n=1 Tax=Euryhalocaulis caribicus TaxID=1161401 RepID=UPI0003A72767|nr:hypothetical protein [Euryhalocaulis caribicus]
MLDDIYLGPGFPEWTELGQESGLDPLGMQRPIELVYQSLLPGISTITLRLRYYSFFTWLLEAYAKTPDIKNEYEAFQRFQRRAEALYALTCARGDVELGVAGIEWAKRQLGLVDPENADALVDFRTSADPESDANLRYLRDKRGAFGGIYASQMREMGLVKTDDRNLLVPFCKDAALALADAFQQAIGDLAEVFLETVAAGKVTLATLDRLAPMKPSKINSGSSEQRELATILFGRRASAAESDQNRGQTLKMLLRIAAQRGRPPKSEESKWAWFGATTGAKDGMDSSEVRPIWALYQASDLFRLAYETLLYAGLRILKNVPPNSMSLEAMIAGVVDMARLADSGSLQDWILDQAYDSDLENHAKAAAHAMQDALTAAEDEQAVKSAWSLIAVLSLKGTQLDRSVLEWLGSADHFQSLASEMKYIELRYDLPVQTAFAELLRERIFRRHLWVASRKFRNQKAYTFLFEPDDGALRFRDFFRVSPSSPRIDQAVQFLCDVKFLDESGVTPVGLDELERG